MNEKTPRCQAKTAEKWATTKLALFPLLHALASWRLGVHFILLLMTPIAHAQSMKIPYPWLADQGDGTYRNPIICADYSDPDVIRDGDDYWLVASSFNCTPGLPILHSTDLINW